MGFKRVHDYAAGKMDWGSYGLPHEGSNVPARTAGDVARKDVPTCTLGEPLEEVRGRVVIFGAGEIPPASVAISPGLVYGPRSVPEEDPDAPLRLRELAGDGVGIEALGGHP